MRKPAARIGDMHDCPAVSPNGVPHLGGPITGPGSSTVYIEGKPAATVGDGCICNGGLDKIVAGSTGVFIEGREAARQGDRCAHGGVVVGGSRTVFIGERMRNMFFSKPNKPTNKDDEFIEPTQEEKNPIIEQAIKECILLLERKLQMLEERDGKTMADFKKWFGWDDEGAVDLILNRIKRALEIAKELTLDNFGVIKDESTKMKSFAQVLSDDEFHTIYLGDLFWSDKHIEGYPRDIVLVHELSHFENIGGTEDFEYGIDQCLHLSKYGAGKALFNAENFESFFKA